MKSKSSQNKIFIKENSWSKVTAEAATSESGWISGRIQGSGQFNFFSKLQGNPASYPAGFGPFHFFKILSSFPKSKAALLRSSNQDLCKMKTLLLSGRHNLTALKEGRPRHCHLSLPNPKSSKVTQTFQASTKR